MTPEEIAALRLKIGVTQEKFAHLIGTTAVTVNRWENGVFKPSRLYVRELKDLRRDHESYIHRREEP